MKIRVILAMIFIVNTVFAQQFEGTIETRISSKMDIREESTVTTSKIEHTTTNNDENKLDGFIQFHIKGERTLVEIDTKEANSQVVKFLFDYSNQDYYIFTDDEKSGTQRIIKQNRRDPMIQRMLERQVMMNEYQKENYIMEPTGEVKMIGAFECMQYLIEGNEGTAEMWITHDFEFDSNPFLPMFSRSPILRNIRFSSSSNDGFIMEMVSTDRAGRKMFMTNTVIKQYIDNDVVAIPNEKGATNMEARKKILAEYQKKIKEAAHDPELLEQLGDELRHKLMQMEKN